MKSFKMKKYCWLVFLVAIIYNVGAELTCKPDGGEKTIKEDVNNYEIFAPRHSVIQHVTCTGLWIFYNGNNYVKDSQLIFGDNSYGRGASKATLKTPIYPNEPYSARKIASANAFNPSITFFEEENFGSKMLRYLTEIPSLPFGKSLIITSGQPWAIFFQEYYKGKGLCLFPKAYAIFGEKPPPTSVRNFSRFPSKSIKSIRSGCSCQKRLDLVSDDNLSRYLPKQYVIQKL